MTQVLTIESISPGPPILRPLRGHRLRTLPPSEHQHLDAETPERGPLRAADLADREGKGRVDEEEGGTEGGGGGAGGRRYYPESPDFLLVHWTSLC